MATSRSRWFSRWCRWYRWCRCHYPRRAIVPPKHERLHKYLWCTHIRIRGRGCVCLFMRMCVYVGIHCLCALLRTTNFFICPPLGIDCVFLWNIISTRQTIKFVCRTLLIIFTACPNSYLKGPFKGLLIAILFGLHHTLSIRRQFGIKQGSGYRAT